LTVRLARREELRKVFALTWPLSGCPQRTPHIAACLRDPKLRSAPHVIAADPAGELLAALTLHPYRHRGYPVTLGIANVFVEERNRGRGIGTRLLRETIELAGRQWDRPLFYVLSEIGPGFYTRFGFRRLPAYDAAPECVPMIRCEPRDFEHLLGDRRYVRNLQAFVD
jgi:predicted N-acetyltransferase YhbS